MEAELPGFLSKGLIFCMKYGKLNEKKPALVNFLSASRNIRGMFFGINFGTAENLQNTAVWKPWAVGLAV